MDFRLWHGVYDMMKTLTEVNNDVRAYLERIGLHEAVANDLTGLNKLICAQLIHVPFEALDVWGCGECPSLHISDLYHKIVTDHRGGYCFELNTLFRWLLNSLGFDAYQVIASLIDVAGEAAPPSHNGIICVIAGEKYFVDVGFGGPVPFGAMRLDETPQLGFRLKKRENFWYLFRQTTEGESCLIRFRDIPAEPCELIPLNFYVSQRPDIHFRHILRVSQRREDGSVCSLVDHELTIHSAGETQVKQVSNMEELRLILREYFAIDIDKVKITRKY